jgi:hypothetical protein
MRLAIAIVAAMAVLAATAEATYVGTWGIALEVPPQLWDDAGSLPLAAAPFRDKFHQDGKSYAIVWAPSTVRAGHSTAEALKLLARRSHGPSAAVLDKPVAASFLAKHNLQQRKIWSDADVLVADEDSPVCRGLSAGQLQKVLRGEITDWRNLYGDWPADRPTAVDLWYPADYKNDPRILFGHKAYASKARKTTDAGTLMTSSNAVGINKLSYALQYVEPGRRCLVPIGGVTPSEATVRDGSYPFAYDVWWVDFKHVDGRHTTEYPASRKRWYHWLWSQKTRHYLQTFLNRRRFLPH